MKNIITSHICVLLLCGCQTFERLVDVGQLPPVTPIENPTKHTNYRPVQMPMPDPIPEYSSKNSLWQAGATSFFKDQRANRVGDILTIKINIDEKAELSNSSNTTRNSSDKRAMKNFLGYEQTLTNLFPKDVDPENLVQLNSNPTHTGSGAIKRKETIVTNLAASVLQILPNGNLIVNGRQEVRINYEIREVIVTGIVRPSDIASDNSIPLEKVAEARVSYGGRGQIDDMQQAPYGHQILNLISPL
jgi:flagellar L-ring protein precursor FlgH